MNRRLTKKMILIGWDSADWKIITPLLDAGKMPALEKLINNGVIGNIATLDPPLSPVLWTSIATGKRADKHGIHGFVEPNPEIGGIRPINVTSRTCKAIWNILNQNGMRSNIIGWWPSHPAEPINGVMISNYYQKIDNIDEDKWFMPDNTVHPEELRNEYFKLRMHIKELTGEILLPFVPKLEEIDQENDKRVASIATFVAQTASLHAATTHAIRTTEWDFTAVYFDAIDHICHGFMKYTPPKVPFISNEDFYHYKDVVSGMYIFHDMLLERYMELADDETTIMLVSDHGFNTEHMRLAEIPHCNTAPAFDHSPFGIFCVSGPNIKKDERVYGATLLDITPTILTCFGLPMAEDMDGKVLLSIFEDEIIPQIIPSYETIEGDSGMHDENTRISATDSAESLRQLVELGYIEDPGEDKNLAAEKAIRENRYNLAKIKKVRKDYQGSLEDFEQLLLEDNTDIRFNLELIKLYIHFKRFVDARKVMTNIKTIKDSSIIEMDILDGIILFNEEKYDEAFNIFDSLSKIASKQPGISLQLALIYLKMDRFDDALINLNKELAIDENNSLAHFHLGMCYLLTGEYSLAANSFLDCIGLFYSMPAAHYYLGISLSNMGRNAEAINALEVFLSMAPSNLNARIILSKLIENTDITKHNLLNEQIIKMKKGEIIIVSGLPRSGTSMMMQLLNAGGVELLTDDIRTPDDNNPKGYYEYMPVKSLAKDASWIPLANGKAIKVIAQLLKFLPETYTYKIIFMKRDITEIIASQMKMLNKPNGAYPIALAETFKKELINSENWIKTQPNIQVIYSDYAELIKSPDSEIDKICRFINIDINNKQKMLQVIDSKLYRNKSNV